MSAVMPRLLQIFRETFDDDTLVIDDSTTAAQVEAWDSLAHVSLIVAVEKEFDVRFTSSEVNGLADVGALRRLVEAKLAR